MDKEKFTWDPEECDEHLFKEGCAVMIASGRSKAAQKVVEALSYEINSKCDFRIVGGRIIILVDKKKYDEASDILYSDWIKGYVVPYSHESYDNETYFVPYQINRNHRFCPYSRSLIMK